MRKQKMSTAADEVLYSDELDYNDRNNFQKKNTTVLDVSNYNDYDRLQEYKAVQGMTCPPGYFLLGNECKDYNECEGNPYACDSDETCINFPGSYKCLSIPCPSDYRRIPSNKNCIKRCTADNKCQKGASVSELIIFRPVALKRSSSVVVYFDEIGEPLCNVAKTRYRVSEANEIFKIRTSQERSSLYAVRQLNRNTLYRVKVEAFSYGSNNVLLHYTEFVLFVVVS